MLCAELCAADAACPSAQGCMSCILGVMCGQSSGNLRRQAWPLPQGTCNQLHTVQAQELEPAQRDQLLQQPAGTSTPEYAAAEAAFRQRFVTHASTAQCLDTAERGRSEAVREALAGGSLFKASISLVSHSGTWWHPVHDAAAPPGRRIILQ